jgi:hypothetical protein
MARVTVTQTNFSAGEWAPTLGARNDVSKFGSSCRTMKNWILNEHGSASTRPGTYYIGRAGGVCRLLPFQFNVEQAYALEFGDQYMRVIRGYDYVRNHMADDFAGYTLTDLQDTRTGSGGQIYRGNEVSVGHGLYVEGTHNAVVMDINSASTGRLYISTDNSITGAAWGTKDCPPAVVKPVNGDFDLAVRTRFAAVPITYSAGYVGMTIRSASNADALQESIVLQKQYNATYDVISCAINATGATDSESADTTKVEHWFRCQRTGNTFTFYYSTDVSTTSPTWTELRSTENPDIGNDAELVLSIANQSGADPEEFQALFGEIYEVSPSYGEPYEIATPYLEADLYRLAYAQTADVMYIVHPSYAPAKLTRTDHDAWTLADVTFGPSIAAPANLTRSVGSGTDNAYVVTAVSALGEESRPSSSAQAGDTDTISWNAVSGADYYRVYKDLDKQTGLYGWLTDVAGTTFKDNSGTPDYDQCSPEAISPFASPGNYPGAVAFFQQRVVYFRTDNQPQTGWGSKIGFYDNFDTTHNLLDSDAWEFTLDSRQLNAVEWVMPLEALLIGSASTEWKMAGGAQGEAITPTSVSVVMQTGHGSASMPPLLIGDTVMFLQYGGRKVREFSYSLEKDRYAGRSMLVFANHLTRRNKIVSWAYQREPDPIVWCVRDDGVLLGMTYLREQDVWGWHRHETQGYVECVCVVPNGEGDDELYMVVRRTLNGTTRRCVEVLEDRLPTSDVVDAIHVDCGRSYYGDPATTIYGLEHLESQAVSVLADGFVVSGLTVSGGAITLPDAASVVHVGLGYTCDLETQELAPGNEVQATRDKLRRVVGVVAVVDDTRALWVGSSEDGLEEVPFRTTELYGNPTELYSGEVEVDPVPLSDASTSRVFVRVSEPLPATVLALVARIDVGGE